MIMLILIIKIILRMTLIMIIIMTLIMMHLSPPLKAFDTNQQK